MNPCELTTFITALANATACSLTVDELNWLGAVLSQFGDTLITIAAQRTLCGGEDGKDTSGGTKVSAPPR